MTKTLVTSALPYANGAMHIGHVRSTYIPADIYVRFLRSRGEDVKFVSGTDEHGTPIVIKAEVEGVSPKVIADRYHKLIDADLKGIGISFDNFSQTSRELHHKTAQEFFTTLSDKGLIFEKEVTQQFCPNCKRFLPDRYVVGTCTHCGKDARGDHCENCGRHLAQGELTNARCANCGAIPESKNTTHYFFKLSTFGPRLKEYLEDNKGISSNARNYALSWIPELTDWDISRELPWGVKIPGTEDKVTYVWFDAPIAYISFTKELLPEGWKDYWKSKVVHFIGKDIIYHHALFWPAMLMGQGELPPPAALCAGGFITLEGEKMSTSRNHVVWIKDYLEAFPSDYLRYFLISAAALDQDIDFSWQSFGEKVNSELIGNYGNFINRALSFCASKFDGRVPELTKLSLEDEQIIKQLQDSHVRVTEFLENFNFIEALKEIMALSRAGNEYFQKKEPWKDGAISPENTINLSVNLARSLAIMARPFLPDSSAKILEQIKTAGEWDDAKELGLEAGHEISKPSPIFLKIEQADINKQIEKLKKKEKAKMECTCNSEETEAKEQITFEDFEKLDLRVAQIKEANPHPNADKLIVLKIDVGGEERQIVAGIKASYEPEELVGKKIVIIANLKPAKIRGVESQGMLLAAGCKSGCSVLTPDKEVESGEIVG